MVRGSLAAALGDPSPRWGAQHLLQRRVPREFPQRIAKAKSRNVPPVPALRRDARGDQPRDVGEREVDAWCAAASLLRWVTRVHAGALLPLLRR